VSISVVAVEFTSNEDIVVCGGMELSNSTATCFAMRLSLDGAIDWFHLYDLPVLAGPISVNELDNSDLMLTTSLWGGFGEAGGFFLRIDSTGSVLSATITDTTDIGPQRYIPAPTNVTARGNGLCMAGVLRLTDLTWGVLSTYTPTHWDLNPSDVTNCFLQASTGAMVSSDTSIVQRTDGGTIGNPQFSSTTDLVISTESLGGVSHLDLCTTLGLSPLLLEQGSNSLHLWPNPAGEWASVEWSVPSSAKALEIFIRDLNGRTMSRISIPSGSDRIDLDLSAMQAGLYVATLYINGSNAVSLRFNHQ
jgi:hypothetical protein